jgi:hypothetical protein
MGGRPSDAWRSITTVYGVRRSLRASGLLAALLALASGCSLAYLGGGSSAPSAASQESGVAIWVPPVVHWEAGGDRRVDLAIENGSTRTIALVQPDPAYARVEVFRGAENLPVCGVEPHATGSEPRPRVEIPPGGSVDVRVDLREACADVPPGDYRFEVDYRSPPAVGALDKAVVFSGAFATRHGVLVVEPGSVAAGAGSTAPARAGRAPPRSSPQRGRD